MVDKLSLALADLDEETVLDTVQERLAAGGDPAAIMEACRDGVVTVGERFETGEYFISDLMMSAEILRQVSAILTPHMKAEGTSSRGKVVFGTAKGDIHDIGKDIVVNIMTDIRKFKQIVGDNVSMLGDVPASLFSTGTPDDVYNYVRDLVRDIGTTGLLLCPGCDAPINTKIENMEAFVAAGRDFGHPGT